MSRLIIIIIIRHCNNHIHDIHIHNKYTYVTFVKLKVCIMLKENILSSMRGVAA